MYWRVYQFFWIGWAFLAGAQSIALGQSPNVRTWGANFFGELGNGISGLTANRKVPGQVSGLSGVVAVAAGNSHNLALKSDGTVWAWGYNLDGELGNGSNGDSYVPVQVRGLTGVSAIAGGLDHSLVLKSDGTVWAWGGNSFGELGNGSSVSSSNVPVQVSGLTAIVAITGGNQHSLALRSDGTVWNWGSNSLGQLGNGSSAAFSNVPVQVSGLTSVVAVAGGPINLALKGDGTVWGWGANYGGQLGNGNTTDSNVPVQVSGLMDVVSISVGNFRSLALKKDGTIWGWPQPGDDGAWSIVPIQERGLMGVSAIAVGSVHGLALKTDGTVLAWGRNYLGELGDGGFADSKVPVQVSGLTSVRAIAAGGNDGLALKTDGTVWSWGYDLYGQRGDGTSGTANVPVHVSGLTDVVAVAGGAYDSLALKSDGTVWAWGQNMYGGIVDGNFANSTVPVRVSGLTDVVAISIGDQVSLALKSDGTVWSLFDVPVQVSDLTGVLAIAGGGRHSLAMKSDGTVWAWGDNTQGQLGLGFAFPASGSGQVKGLTGVVAIAANSVSSRALKSDGTVWAWGFGYGAAPLQVGGLMGVVKIAAGGYSSSLALKSDGTTVPNLGLTGVVAIASGGNHSSVVKSDGTVWAWGFNRYGDLGNGSNVDSAVPVQVSGLTGAVAIAVGYEHGLAVLAGSIPELIVSPASLNFGDSGTQIITVTNGGTAPLSIDNIVLSGINPADFKISSTCPETPVSPAHSCMLRVTFAPTALGSRSAALLLVANAPGSPILVPLSGTGLAVRVLAINADGVVNASSYKSPVAPGGIATVFGNFPLASPVTSTSFPIPANLAGLSLQLGDAPPAPLFYASQGQVNAQIPWELSGQSQTTITATLNGQNSAPQKVNLAAYAPGIFATNGQGTGQGAIFDSTYRLVDSTNPATAGTSVVQIYCTGMGPVTNQPATGAASPGNPLAATTTVPTVTIGGARATVSFSGLTPGLVGEYQVNAAVPADSARGSAVPVVITIGAVSSNTVTMAIK